jgi:hypothetical protein
MDGGKIMIGCIPTPEEARAMLRNSVTIRMPVRDGFNRITKLQQAANEESNRTGEDYNTVLAKLAKRRKIEVEFYDSKGNPVGNTPPVKVVTPESQEVINVLNNLLKNSK